MSECVNPPCDREATIRVKPSPMGNKRNFCEVCYRAWKRGAHVMFTNGVPTGEQID